MPRVKLNRAEFVQRLEAAQPGLDSREGVEQSSCFILKDGYVYTYNEEVACRIRSGLPDEFNGPVQAVELLSLLRTMTVETISVEVDGGKLKVTGKSSERAGVAMHEKIYLPIEKVERPVKWRPLPEGFQHAVDVVGDCTGKDESAFVATCLHLTPDCIEATDGVQVIRYDMVTGVKQPVLVRQAAVKFSVDLGTEKFSETDNWIHFKNKIGLVVSCRRYIYPESEGYPDLKAVLKKSRNGTMMDLKRDIVNAVEKAQIFSKNSSDKKARVQVNLSTGKITIRGQGAMGYYERDLKSKYDGDPIQFVIPPNILVGVTEKHSEQEVTVTENFLRIQGGSFTYTTALGRVKANKEQVSVSEDTDGGK